MSLSAKAAAEYIRSEIPIRGLFAGMDWRISPEPFRLEKGLVSELEKLGRVLLQFNKAANQLYLKSIADKVPGWVADYLDRGKPRHLIEWQRSANFKSDLPRVIRPDILLTDEGFKITELDSVPGGIGLTAWLNKTYSEVRKRGGEFGEVVGSSGGMMERFRSIFPKEGQVHIVISKESETYVPEMEWLAESLASDRFGVKSTDFMQFRKGDSVYRFFELFDIGNLRNGSAIIEKAEQGELSLTAPPKAFIEEKMMFSLLWNRNLEGFWRQELGGAFLQKMQKMVPYSWIVDPAPLPPQGAIPELNLTDWTQLKGLSQRERDLILKVSGFSENAWGARGVYLGSDLSVADWGVAVDEAINSFDKNPFILQRYHKPKAIDVNWYDFESDSLQTMSGRVRLCPYYFVHGEGDSARAQLSGVLATICPADKKIIHGMRDAILAPVVAV